MSVQGGAEDAAAYLCWPVKNGRLCWRDLLGRVVEVRLGKDVADDLDFLDQGGRRRVSEGQPRSIALAQVLTVAIDNYGGRPTFALGTDRMVLGGLLVQDIFCDSINWYVGHHPAEGGPVRWLSADVRFECEGGFE